MLLGFAVLFCCCVGVVYTYKLSTSPQLLVKCRFRIGSCHSSRTAIPTSTAIVGSAQQGNGAPVILKCEGLSKSYTGVPQFESISLGLSRGQRVGLIGINGAGKSTLLKCLSKLEPYDTGLVETATNTNVIYVDQEPNWGSICVHEALFSGPSNAAATVRKYYNVMKNEDNIDMDAFAAVTDAMQEFDGWEYQERGQTIATNLNICESFMYRSVSALSGGERKRVGLAAALLKQPDVLLLDEVSQIIHPQHCVICWSYISS